MESEWIITVSLLSLFAGLPVRTADRGLVRAAVEDVRAVLRRVA